MTTDLSPAPGEPVGISSLGGRIANAGLAAYQAAKFAVGAFSEALAQEITPLGLHVTELEPGGMRTDWAGSSMTIRPISQAYLPTVEAPSPVPTQSPTQQPPPTPGGSRRRLARTQPLNDHDRTDPAALDPLGHQA